MSWERLYQFDPLGVYLIVSYLVEITMWVKSHQDAILKSVAFGSSEFSTQTIKHSMPLPYGIALEVWWSNSEKPHELPFVS